jgi:glycosyltransferase involved in cell wall biosynthesis
MAQTSFDQRSPLGVLVKVFPKLSETFILEEVLGLERMGLPLRLYSLEPPSDALTHRAVGDVRASSMRVPKIAEGGSIDYLQRHLRLAHLAPVRYLATLALALRRGRQGLRDFGKAGWLAQQLRRDGVRHLHAHFISRPGDIAQLASRLAGMPFSLSAHAKDIYLSKPEDVRRKLEAARFTVTCTEFNRATLAAIAPLAHVRRLYHGVDHRLFHPRRRLRASSVPLILSVGRLREKKGLDTLIDACEVLRRRGQSFACQIVGYGEEQARLQSRIDGLGLGDHVELVGKLTRDEILVRYARAAVYVQPSRIAADGDRDGIPNVLLEAMAMGVPIVASNVSGIPELVAHGRNGLLVEPDRPEALAEAIMQMLKRPRLQSGLARRARDTVTGSFDNDRNLALLCALFEGKARDDRMIDDAIASTGATTPLAA